MLKFDRNYILTIEKRDGTTLTVTLPFTIEFDITRNVLSSANVCQIRVYNLSLENRNQIRFNASDYGTYREITLQAGYGDNLATIFTGNISQAWSVREGVNFITQIECYDGGFAFVTGQTNIEFPAGTPQKTVISTLADSLPHVSLGAVGDYPDNLGRGNSYSGNTTDILRNITGGGFFIDGGKANALNTDEYIASDGDLVITSDSGLLGTPELEETIVRFRILFEPGLVPGEIVTLDSITEANFNGVYKVTGVKHRGMISAAVCGTVETEGSFFFSKILLPVTSP